MNRRIKELRKNYLGLTLEEFGSKIGVAKSTLSNIEIGRFGITDLMIKSICREYNVNEEWLRNGTGEIFNVPTDELAGILSELLENPEADFYNLILTLARTYAELSPSSQMILDEYTRKFIHNLHKNSYYRFAHKQGVIFLGFFFLYVF